MIEMRMQDLNERIKRLEERRTEQRGPVEQQQPRFNKAGRKKNERLEYEVGYWKKAASDMESESEVRRLRGDVADRSNQCFALQAKIAALEKESIKFEVLLRDSRSENAKLKEERKRVNFVPSGMFCAISLQQSWGENDVLAMSDGSRWVPEGDIVKACDQTERSNDAVWPQTTINQLRAEIEALNKRTFSIEIDGEGLSYSDSVPVIPMTTMTYEDGKGMKYTLCSEQCALVQKSNATGVEQ